MTGFPDLESFAAHLSKVAAEVQVAQHEGLKHAAETIEKEAKSAIGEYQEVAGPFGAWAPLSPATLSGKAELKYSPPDNPLLREGDLRESIEHTVRGNEAVVGSNSDVAVWQELGTPGAKYPIPPRSFLGRAAFVKAPEVVSHIAARVVRALNGL